MRITASVFASTSATHSRSSKPPPYPPAIRITGAPGNAFSATRPASGFVALESLYQRTPAHSPTSSSLCSTPRNERMALLIASSLNPAMRPTAGAASALSMLLLPGTGLGGDLIHAVEHRVAAVAPHDDWAVAGRQNHAGERSRGRLAVGPGDADHRSIARLQKQVDLARDPDAFRAGFVEQLGIPRHAWARVNHIDTLESAGVVAAQT